MIEGFINAVGTGRRGQLVRCGCGGTMISRGVKGKELLTLLGPLAYRRSWYQCPDCGAVRYPGDEALDVVGTSRSPGVRRQVSRLGSKEAFREVARDMRELAGVKLSRKDAERVSERTGEAVESWMAEQRRALRCTEPPPPESSRSIETLYIEFDGTGVPMVQNEVAGRKGKQKDGSAKTREAKLGCVFTQTGFDEQRRPIRDPATTSFVGAIERAESFGWRIYAEAVRRGLFDARRVVCLGDAAQWVKNLAQLHFPSARFIIDFYHAKQHVMELCRALFGLDTVRITRYRDRWWELLADGRIEQLLHEARAHLPKDPRTKKDARTQIRYFEKNKDYMRYAQFREQGLFIGSGVVEAGCKTIIGQRLKQSGMEWTVRGANAIIALRCITLSRRFEDYWESRAA